MFKHFYLSYLIILFLIFEMFVQCQNGIFTGSLETADIIYLTMYVYVFQIEMLDCKIRVENVNILSEKHIFSSMVLLLVCTVNRLIFYTKLEPSFLWIQTYMFDFESPSEWLKHTRGQRDAFI